MLLGLTFLVHLFAGGADVYEPLRASNLEAEPRATLFVVWHAVSWFLLLFAVAPFWLSRRYNEPLALIVGASQAGFAVLFFAYGYAEGGSVFFLPQWTVFATATLLIAIGHWRRVA